MKIKKITWQWIGAIYITIVFVFGIIARRGGIKGYETYTWPIIIALLIIGAILLVSRIMLERKK